MTAAVTAAERGHEVTLFEKTDSLGGILKFTDKDLHKGDLRKFKEHLAAMVKKLGVNVRFNTEATADIIEADKPDVVIAATGSVAIKPDIPGIKNAIHALDVYYDTVKIGEKVVIIGGGLAGCETALHLADLDKDVTVIEMISELAPDCYPYHRRWMLHRLEMKVKAETGLTCTEIASNGVWAVNKKGEKKFFEAETMVYATGMKSVSPEEFQKAAPMYYYQVGDCVRPAKVKEAVHDAFFAAVDI
jgi:pyruvate/2-oxoglutarate dehydrogenase complex dihydrolipoamide dehydrogenase (E3) component